MDVQELEVQVVTQGEITDAAKQYATDKVTQLTRYTNRPILFAQVKLTLGVNPRLERPALAEATLNMNGLMVRAHVASHDVMAAIDLLDDRLRRRLDRFTHRSDPKQQRPPTDGEWRHGDLPKQRPEYHERPVEDREVVRLKTFALDPMTVEEAAFDLDVLGHDFYLFTDLDTKADSVIYYAPDDAHLELMQAADSVVIPEVIAVPVRPSSQQPVETTLADAQERLDTGLEPFVFFVNPESARGNVIYRRFDGHYGLITPA